MNILSFSKIPIDSFSSPSSWRGLASDIMLLGKDIGEGLSCRLNYFLIDTNTSSYSEENASCLRSMGLYVPFVKMASVQAYPNGVDIIITEDLTEGGRYKVYDATEYIQKDPPLRNELEEIIKDIKKNVCVVSRQPHLVKCKASSSDSIALRKMFLVRVKGHHRELIPNDLGHLSLGSRL